MKWDDLRVFLAVARNLSLTAAAKELGVNQSTVSRRLHALESRMGTHLVDRAAGGNALTAAGTDLLERAAYIEQDIVGIERRLSQRDSLLGGRLRITCTDNFLNRYLAPHFAAFAADNPEIDLDILTHYQHLSLARREADVAIRTTVKPSDTLVGRRLFRFALGVYAAPELRRRLGNNPAPEAIEWIGWDNEAYNRFMITDHYPGANIRHRAQSLVDMTSLAQAGLGVAVLGCFSGDPDPLLERVYSTAITDSPMDLWILAHPDARRLARVRNFTSYIADVFMRDRDLFEGARAV